MYVVTADAVGPNKIAAERGLDQITPFTRVVETRDEASLLVTMMALEVFTRYGFDVKVPDGTSLEKDETLDVYANVGDEVMFHFHSEPQDGTASVS